MKRQIPDKQLAITEILGSQRIQLDLQDVGIPLPQSKPRSVGNPAFIPKWKSQTVAVRIPEIYRDRIIGICREWDQGKDPEIPATLPEEIPATLPVPTSNPFVGFCFEARPNPESKNTDRPSIVYLDPHEIKIDPTRFQFKIVHNANGESGSLSGVDQWDYSCEGILLVWQDPLDGHTYVINGHNRLSLARKLGIPDLPCQYLNADSAIEARAMGARANIKSGNGNALDCGKFLRDTGITDLKILGIPQNTIAKQGLALSRLSESLFFRVITGDLDETLAIQIGSAIEDHDLQQQAVKTLEGKNHSKSMIQDILDEIKASSHQVEEITLFGSSFTSESLIEEIAELKNHIRRDLSAKKRLFTTVVNNNDLLKTGNNSIDVITSQEISLDSKTILGRFEIESKFSGMVCQTIRDYAKRLKDSKNRFEVKQDCLEEVIKLLA